MSEPHSQAVPSQETRRLVDAALNVWTRRLIDQSRNNPLLFYRDLKVGTLDLTEQVEAVARLLAGEKLTVDFLVSAAQLAQSSDPLVRAQAEAEAHQKLRSALVALQRKALSNLEEKGIETLYLAMGMATWDASDGGRPYDAPMLLLPARIETLARKGAHLRVALVGEPQLNPVLLYVLEENYAIRIDASAVLTECINEDESGQWCINPEDVFARIEREVTKTIRDFKVRRRVVRVLSASVRDGGGGGG